MSLARAKMRDFFSPKKPQANIALKSVSQGRRVCRCLPLPSHGAQASRLRTHRIAPLLTARRRDRSRCAGDPPCLSRTLISVRWPVGQLAFPVDLKVLRQGSPTANLALGCFPAESTACTHQSRQAQSISVCVHVLARFPVHTQEISPHLPASSHLPRCVVLFCDYLPPSLHLLHSPSSDCPRIAYFSLPHSFTERCHLAQFSWKASLEHIGEVLSPRVACFSNSTIEILGLLHRCRRCGSPSLEPGSLGGGC
ncbi:hypothetical protein B0J12DRAFT_216823 [Macrophomina phaseolina]|uniref:Uncharacterized protein n=1 Tax=Macrophomina phaseolina TaxID=35725 RepID=A0ABQ8G106_9PEZI|nr:hypothetical protein B0J12DRAFT_216823 [Macrophomina phaseolina]